MIKVSDLSSYSRDMTVGELIEQLKNERPFSCPKCGGSGKLFQEAEINYDMGGYHGKDGYAKCDICDGYGRTKKEFKPVYKVVDYKEYDVPNETNENQR